MTTKRRPDRLLDLDGWCAVFGVEILIESGRTPTLRASDVVVLRASAADDRARQLPSDVLSVVEVLSPGTRRTDRVAELAEYAEAGIAHDATALDLDALDRQVRAGDHRQGAP